MTIKEFFWLNDDEFRAKIARVSDDELEDYLTHNRRARHGGKYGAVAGATIGVGAATTTFGVSSIGVPMGLRRHSVAKRRMEMILQEYQRRCLQPKDESRHDRGIPMAATAVGAGLTFGIFSGGEALVMPALEAGHVGVAEGLYAVTNGATGAAAQQIVGMGGEHMVEEPLKDSGSLHCSVSSTNVSVTTTRS